MNLKLEKKEVSAVSSKYELISYCCGIQSRGEALHTGEIERPPKEDADNSLWYTFFKMWPKYFVCRDCGQPDLFSLNHWLTLGPLK